MERRVEDVCRRCAQAPWIGLDSRRRAFEVHSTSCSRDIPPDGRYAAHTITLSTKFSLKSTLCTGKDHSNQYFALVEAKTQVVFKVAFRGGDSQGMRGHIGGRDRVEPMLM